MGTTIRVEDSVKADFDRLQGMVQMETGQKLSHSELLARLIRSARRHPSNLMDSDDSMGPRWSAKDWQAFERSLPDWGVQIDVSKIDEVLYGGDKP
ncbi:MAG: hypothetical protein ACYDDF_12015 [Thermoplasmatota archaeon]